MYMDFTPLCAGVDDYLCSTNPVIISELMEAYSDEPVIVCEEFKNFALAVLSEYNLQQPSTVDHALELFFVLTHIIEFD